jgi:hypothetical protein
VSAEYKTFDLLDLSTPKRTFPSANPKSSSLGWSFGQTMQVVEAETGNLLHMAFFSPHYKPIL